MPAGNPCRRQVRETRPSPLHVQLAGGTMGQAGAMQIQEQHVLRALDHLAPAQPVRVLLLRHPLLHVSWMVRIIVMTAHRHAAMPTVLM